MKGMEHVFCSEYSWYGWAPNDKQASISTTLHGIGKAVLEFGNCWKSGKVVAYKNNVEIKSIDARNEAQVEFDFENGDVLKITEHGEGIIRFDDLRFDWCAPSDEYVSCEANSHVDNLKESKSHSVFGWYIDPEINGPWNANAPNLIGESCSDASWIGWDVTSIVFHPLNLT